jgi:hypothetical protein
MKRSIKKLTVSGVSGDDFNVNGGRRVHEWIGGNDGEVIPDSEVHSPGRTTEIEREQLLSGLHIPNLRSLICATSDKRHGIPYISKPNQV